jgi:hypothetical protein
MTHAHYNCSLAAKEFVPHFTCANPTIGIETVAEDVTRSVLHETEGIFEYQDGLHREEGPPAGGANRALGSAFNSGGMSKFKTEALDPNAIQKGGVYWYRDKMDGVEKQVEVVAIDRSVEPPSFAIRVDGRERETEAHRLSLNPSWGGKTINGMESLVERLHVLIQGEQGSLAGKITGMLVGALEESELAKICLDHPARQSMIAKARDALEASKFFELAVSGECSVCIWSRY